MAQIVVKWVHYPNGKPKDWFLHELVVEGVYRIDPRVHPALARKHRAALARAAQRSRRSRQVVSGGIRT